jgi:hypothetical protein
MPSETSFWANGDYRTSGQISYVTRSQLGVFQKTAPIWPKVTSLVNSLDISCRAMIAIQLFCNQQFITGPRRGFGLFHLQVRGNAAQASFEIVANDDMDVVLPGRQVKGVGVVNSVCLDLG